MVGWRETLGFAVKKFFYEGFRRDEWQQPDKVIAALDLSPGMAVADLGSGAGYFTYRLARALAPSGTVFAVDTDTTLLDAIRARAAREGLNITTVEASDGDLRLPHAVDLIFLSNVYHHLPGQSAYFAKVRDLLKPDGRLAIVESRPEGLFARLLGHATSPAIIRRSMEQAGYRLEASHDFVDRHSFQIFSVDRGESGSAAASGEAPAGPG